MHLGYDEDDTDEDEGDEEEGARGPKCKKNRQLRLPYISHAELLSFM